MLGVPPRAQNFPAPGSRAVGWLHREPSVAYRYDHQSRNCYTEANPPPRTAKQHHLKPGRIPWIAEATRGRRRLAAHARRRAAVAAAGDGSPPRIHPVSPCWATPPPKSTIHRSFVFKLESSTTTASSFRCGDQRRGRTFAARI